MTAAIRLAALLAMLLAVAPAPVLAFGSSEDSSAAAAAPGAEELAKAQKKVKAEQ